MALKKFYVLYNKAPETTRITGVTVSKAEAEKKHGKLGSTETNAVVIPDQEPFAYTVAEMEAESAEAACIAARLYLGASASEGELLVGETSGLSKKSCR